LMVRALGLEPRTNALKWHFNGLQGVAIVCTYTSKSFIFSLVLTGWGKAVAWNRKGYRKKYHKSITLECMLGP
jgi:hypothetical protein